MPNDITMILLLLFCCVGFNIIITIGLVLNVKKYYKQLNHLQQSLEWCHIEEKVL